MGAGRHVPHCGRGEQMGGRRVSRVGVLMPHWQEGGEDAAFDGAWRRRRWCAELKPATEKRKTRLAACGRGTQRGWPVPPGSTACTRAGGRPRGRHSHALQAAVQPYKAHRGSFAAASNAAMQAAGLPPQPRYVSKARVPAHSAFGRGPKAHRTVPSCDALNSSSLSGLGRSREGRQKNSEAHVLMRRVGRLASRVGQSEVAHPGETSSSLQQCSLP